MRNRERFADQRTPDLIEVVDRNELEVVEQAESFEHLVIEIRGQARIAGLVK